MSECVYSIGSNLGDRLGHLRGAVDALRPWLVAASPVFETPPWGPVPQDPYLNAVLRCADPDASPRDWLERGFAAERAAGRERDVRWGPRTLDVDVVAVSVDGVEQEDDDPQLTLPHPRAAERAFVLVPWLALDPDAVLAGKPVGERVAALPAADVQAVRRCEGGLR